MLRSHSFQTSGGFEDTAHFHYIFLLYLLGICAKHFKFHFDVVTLTR